MSNAMAILMRYKLGIHLHKITKKLNTKSNYEIVAEQIVNITTISWQCRHYLLHISFNSTYLNEKRTTDSTQTPEFEIN